MIANAERLYLQHEIPGPYVRIGIHSHICPQREETPYGLTLKLPSVTAGEDSC